MEESSEDRYVLRLGFPYDGPGCGKGGSIHVPVEGAGPSSVPDTPETPSRIGEPSVRVATSKNP